jgi:FKBP-type peptidyl-prolyl cis-trans isomerase 2
MVLNKKDFIEIEFTGKTKEGDVFDSNVKEELEKGNIKGYPKPFLFCLGEGMFVKGIDDFLVGKEIKEYEVSLKPEDAFGKRNPKLIQMIPIKEFTKHRLNPLPGAMFNFDGRLAKILTVSGGRVMIDFNNPLAGKEVDYHIKVLRKIDDLNEKINALNDFFFRQNFKFDVQDTKLILEIPKGMKKFIEMFSDKYKDMLGLDLEIAPEDVPSNSE